MDDLSLLSLGRDVPNVSSRLLAIVINFLSLLLADVFNFLSRSDESP